MKITTLPKFPTKTANRPSESGPNPDLPPQQPKDERVCGSTDSPDPRSALLEPRDKKLVKTVLAHALDSGLCQLVGGSAAGSMLCGAVSGGLYLGGKMVHRGLERGDAKPLLAAEVVGCGSLGALINGAKNAASSLIGGPLGEGLGIGAVGGSMLVGASLAWSCALVDWRHSRD